MSDSENCKVTVLPDPKIDYLAKLTDSTCIAQHAIYSVPDMRHGYCIDDAGRALVAALDFHHLYGDPRALECGLTYLKYLHCSQLLDGRFYGFMNFARQFISEPDSRDAMARAMWGLAYASTHWPEEGPRKFAAKVLRPSWNAVSMDCPRALAYCCVAANAYLESRPGDKDVRDHLGRYASRLIEMYDSVSSEDWQWFENVIAYGNAILPYGVLMAYDVLRESRMAEVGRDTLEFLIEVTMNGECLDLVGHDGWCRRNGTRARFDQQPIDAGYMTVALAAAARILESDRYRVLARTAAEWFLGRNIVGVPLYDKSTGACRDGLEPDGPNQNMGAESTAVCLMALLRVPRSVQPPGAGL